MYRDYMRPLVEIISSYPPCMDRTFLNEAIWKQ